MSSINNYIEELRKDETREDQFTLKTLNFSITFLKSTLSKYVVTKFLTLTTLSYFGLEVILAAILM